MTCLFCGDPLIRRSFIRPGGLPFSWWGCDCHEAELAHVVAPSLVGALRLGFGLTTVLATFPDESRPWLMRACP